MFTIVVVIAFIIVIFLLNKILFLKSSKNFNKQKLFLKQNNIKTLMILFVFVVVLSVSGNVSTLLNYSSVDECLLWTELIVGDTGIFAPVGKKDVGGACIYTTDEYVLQGIIVNDGDSYKKSSVDLVVSEAKRIDEKVYSVSCYESDDYDKLILIINGRNENIADFVQVNNFTCNKFYDYYDKNSVYCLVDRETRNLNISIKGELINITL